MYLHYVYDSDLVIYSTYTVYVYCDGLTFSVLSFEYYF